MVLRYRTDKTTLFQSGKEVGVAGPVEDGTRLESSRARCCVIIAVGIGRDVRRQTHDRVVLDESSCRVWVEPGPTRTNRGVRVGGGDGTGPH
ncbi:hypothetical protein L484_004304 [Morus notabilis]|uniref:Uncharacterized protein n=1 Tax=Morus notabilis TaxID=981085 RepID=W9RDY6_9ROSA|nr:hypothetical protein L484_004304 [Morus notabilis]